MAKKKIQHVKHYIAKISDDLFMIAVSMIYDYFSTTVIIDLTLRC